MSARMPMRMRPPPASADPVPGHDGLVQLDAQPRLLRHADVAVADREALPRQRLPQRPLLDAVFEIPAVRQRGPDVGQVALLALAHRPPAELDGAVTLPGQAAGATLGLGGRVPEEDGGVGPELLAEGATQELVNRPAGRLAGEVPQGDLDAT